MICPLKYTAKTEDHECEEKNCSWWTIDECVVLRLRSIHICLADIDNSLEVVNNSLRDLNDEVGQLRLTGQH